MRSKLWAPCAMSGEQQQLRDQRSAIEARLQQRTRQTLLRIMKHHLATAFAGLLTAVKLSKRRRGKACQVLARLRRMRLARSFRTLLKTVQFEREVRKSREAEMETMDKNTQGQPVWFTHGSGIALGVKDRIQKQAQHELPVALRRHRADPRHHVIRPRARKPRQRIESHASHITCLPYIKISALCEVA